MSERRRCLVCEEVSLLYLTQSEHLAPQVQRKSIMEKSDMALLLYGMILTLRVLSFKWLVGIVAVSHRSTAHVEPA